MSPGFNPDHVDPFVYVDHIQLQSLQKLSRFSEGAGHYTALIWANTDEVGCGFTYYTEKIGPFDAWKSLVVCNYAKGGNYAGQPMYKIGEPCTECDDGYACENDLCVKQ